MSYWCSIYIEVFSVVVVAIVVVCGAFGTLVVYTHTHTQQVERTLHIYEIHLQNERSSLGDSQLISCSLTGIFLVYTYTVSGIWYACA